MFAPHHLLVAVVASALICGALGKPHAEGDNGNSVSDENDFESKKVFIWEGHSDATNFAVKSVSANNTALFNGTVNSVSILAVKVASKKPASLDIQFEIKDEVVLEDRVELTMTMEHGVEQSITFPINELYRHCHKDSEGDHVCREGEHHTLSGVVLTDRMLLHISGQGSSVDLKLTAYYEWEPKTILFHFSFFAILE